MSKVRKASQKDLKRIKEMCDEYISLDFYSEEFWKKAYEDENQYIVLYANDEDIPVGFIYMFRASYKKAREILKIPDNADYLRDLSDDDIVGVFKTTCTDKAYRRQGILKLLMESCEDMLRNDGITLILLDALKLPSGEIPAESGIEKTKFKKIAEIKHPWADIDSFCPYCKSRFCRCDAVLCIKEIGENV